LCLSAFLFAGAILVQPSLSQDQEQQKIPGGLLEEARKWATPRADDMRIRSIGIAPSGVSIGVSSEELTSEGVGLALVEVRESDDGLFQWVISARVPMQYELAPPESEAFALALTREFPFAPVAFLPGTSGFWVIVGMDTYEWPQRDDLQQLVKRSADRIQKVQLLAAQYQEHAIVNRQRVEANEASWDEAQAARGMAPNQ
jgi:hypothetical protein